MSISRLRIVVIPGVLLMMLLISACGGAGEAKKGEQKVFELSFAHYLGKKGGHQVSLRDWAEDIERATEGQVKINFYWSESLLKATEILPGVADGRASIGYTGAFYHPRQLILSNMAEIPFLTSNPEAQIRAFNELYGGNNVLKKEYKDNGVHALLFPPITSNILGGSEPYLSLDDIEGKSIRATGVIGQAIELAGAQPVALAAPEMYQGLERGVIDAYTSFAFELIADLGLQEVAPHVVDSGIGNYTQGVVIIDLDTWNSLPENIQHTITEVSSEYHKKAVTDFLVDIENKVCTELLAAGGSATVWSDAEIQEFKGLVGDRFRDQWIEEAGRKWGADRAQRLLEQYVALLNEYEQKSDYVSGISRCAARDGRPTAPPQE